jgi:hypothetical protein
MRAVMLAVIVAALTQVTSAQQAGQSDPQATPNQQLNPQATPDSQMSAELEAMMKLQAFAKQLAEQGFKDVQIVPQAVLVSAKDKADKPVLMIFDTQTMLAVQLQTPQGETTGSGSSGDEKPDR